MANFKASARSVDMLGRQQIAGIPNAINEIFKNAYDNLHIVFNRLGIKHNYRIDYLDKFFNKNC